MPLAPISAPLPVAGRAFGRLSAHLPERSGAWLGWAALAVWTGAWTFAGLLQQESYQPRRDHISGLAALNAEHPEVMIAGFVITGLLILALTVRLWRSLPGNHWIIAGVGLLVLVGTGFIAAGLLRNDCADAVAACAIRDAHGTNSWHSRLHNLIASSLLVYALVPALFALALRGERGSRGLRHYSLGTAVLSVAVLVAFQLRWWIPWEGVLQRTAVSLPLVWTAVVCARLGQLKQALAETFSSPSAATGESGAEGHARAIVYAAFSLTQRAMPLPGMPVRRTSHRSRYCGARSPPALGTVLAPAPVPRVSGLVRA